MVDHEPVIRLQQHPINCTITQYVRQSSSHVTPSKPQTMVFDLPFPHLFDRPLPPTFFSSFHAHRSPRPAATTYTTPSSLPGVIGLIQAVFLFPFAFPWSFPYGYSKRHGNEFDITASSRPLWLEVRKSLKGWAIYYSVTEGVGGGGGG